MNYVNNGLEEFQYKKDFKLQPSSRFFRSSNVPRYEWIEGGNLKIYTKDLMFKLKIFEDCLEFVNVIRDGVRTTHPADAHITVPGRPCGRETLRLRYHGAEQEFGEGKHISISYTWLLHNILSLSLTIG